MHSAAEALALWWERECGHSSQLTREQRDGPERWLDYNPQNLPYITPASHDQLPPTGPHLLKFLQVSIHSSLWGHLCSNHSNRVVVILVRSGWGMHFGIDCEDEPMCVTMGSTAVKNIQDTARSKVITDKCRTWGKFPC